MIQTFFTNTVVSILVSLFTTSAFAYVSVQDTGDTLEKGQYRAIFEPQFLFSKKTGANIATRVDANVAEGTDVRALLGVGSAIDFFTGGFVKWSPYPDFGNQPAIAGQLGIVYSRYDGEPEVSFRFNPIVSKRFESRHGQFTPYASIPLALETRKSVAVGTAQLALGTQFQSLQWKNIQFSAELGLNLKDSFSYVGAGVIFYFDEENGFSAN